MSLRNVIYFSSNANQIPLPGIANLPYTDVIVAFLVPDGNLNLVGAGGAFDDNLQSNIQTLQNAGKNVLISFGGATFPSSAYQSYAQNVNGLVGQIVNFVTSYGFNGVDIDYEDDAGFTGTYDGIGFLSALTNGLAQALPSGQNIITHAPQTPYWDSNYYNAPYAQIWQQVGNQITWINNQFYDNPDYDKDAATKVLWYQNVAAITGAQNLLVGALVADTGQDEGYITLDDMINNVINPLMATFGSQFGGVMGWEFALDQGGTWANGIGQALGTAMACPGQSYTVVAGDTLVLIAQRFLGNGALWVELTKPDGTTFTEAEAENLQIGQVVCIPGQSIDYSIWSLQEPSGSGTSPTTISPSQLVAGYSDAYFYIAADGGQAFMDTQTGITTPGSTHCRTELRELTSSGAHAAWAPSGTNTMDVAGQVTLLGGGSSGKVTVGQVYNSNDSIPLCELMYSGSVGGFVLHYEEAKGAGTDIDLQTPFALNTPYSFQLSLTNDVLTVSINGQQVYSHTPSSSILANEFYFKCGNYDQTTTAGEVTTTPYTIVEIYSINVVHA
jgi:chitinase